MSISLDSIINPLKSSIFNPIALIVYIAYRWHIVQWKETDQDWSIKIAYSILAIYFIRSLSNRWRNGFFGNARLNENSWKQEIVLVTGAAQGIGSETVKQLSKKGCKVVAVDIVHFKSDHPNIFAFQCNIANYDALKQLQAKVKKEIGTEVTMVVNVAGVNNKSLILDLNKEKVDRMLDINLKSHFYTAMIFLPYMIKRKRGHFLSVSSAMGYAGICHQSDYVATKHGLLGMHESLYYEIQIMYKTPKVRTSIAMIGHTQTALFQDFNTGPIGRFLAPLLPPAYVASLLVDALESQESRIILTPALINFLPAFKMLPSFIRDTLQALSGGDGSYPTRPTHEQLNG